MLRLLALLLSLVACTTHARTAAEYLPADANLDNTIPTPASVLGWEVGDWHVGHDALVNYLYRLADASPRVSLREIGRSNEQRPLLQVLVSSPGNQGRMEELRQAHLDGSGPLVVWLGYSVHGNEASGSNAAPIIAWHLAASQSEFISALRTVMAAMTVQRMGLKPSTSRKGIVARYSCTTGLSKR